MRVLILEYNIGLPTADKYLVQHRALAKYCDVHIVHCGPEEISEFPSTIVSNPYPAKDLMMMSKYARDIVMKVPDFDVVYCRNGGPRRQLQDLMIAKIADKPAVIKIGGDGYTVRRHVPMNPQALLYDDMIDRVSLTGFDQVIPLGEDMRKSALRAGVHPQRISPNLYLGIDKSQKALPYPDELVVGYAGRLAPEKGIDFLFKVARKCPEIQFKTAGDIEIQGLEFPDNVHHRGLLKHEAMDKFYRDITIGALPSHSEGCSNFLLELMIRGRTFISTIELDNIWGGKNWSSNPRNVELWASILRANRDGTFRSIGMEAREQLLETWPSWDDYGRGLYQRISAAVSPK